MLVKHIHHMASNIQLQWPLRLVRIRKRLHKEIGLRHAQDFRLAPLNHGAPLLKRRAIKNSRRHHRVVKLKLAIRVGQ